jgi:hypothetical protein
MEVSIRPPQGHQRDGNTWLLLGKRARGAGEDHTHRLPGSYCNVFYNRNSSKGHRWCQKFINRTERNMHNAPDPQPPKKDIEERPCMSTLTPARFDSPMTPWVFPGTLRGSMVVSMTFKIASIRLSDPFSIYECRIADPFSVTFANHRGLSRRPFPVFTTRRMYLDNFSIFQRPRVLSIDPARPVYTLFCESLGFCETEQVVQEKQ